MKKVDNLIDIRDTAPEYYNTYQPYEKGEVEWFKNPTQFKHFKARVNLLSEGITEMGIFYDWRWDFYDILKYKIMNLIPTVNKKLTECIYAYINYRFGPEYLEYMIKVNVLLKKLKVKLDKARNHENNIKIVNIIHKIKDVEAEYERRR